MRYRITIPVQVRSQPRKGGIVDTSERELAFNVEADSAGFAVLSLQAALQEMVACARDTEREGEAANG